MGLLDNRWWTIELPWKDNEVRVSCIPAGTYTVKQHTSPSKGSCFEIQDVPGRTHILLHVANWAKDVLGCIGPGQGINLRSDMVTSSQAAMNEMLEILPDEFELEIIDAC